MSKPILVYTNLLVNKYLLSPQAAFLQEGDKETYSVYGGDVI
jgi:hypothetical protein